MQGETKQNLTMSLLILVPLTLLPGGWGRIVSAVAAGLVAWLLASNIQHNGWRMAFWPLYAIGAMVIMSIVPDTLREALSNNTPQVVVGDVVHTFKEMYVSVVSIFRGSSEVVSNDDAFAHVKPHYALITLIILGGLVRQGIIAAKQQ